MPEPITPVISFEDFAKMDLRVGQVISAERVSGSEKLLRLMIDDGSGTPRQIIAGLGKHYQPESLVNKQLVFIANLTPRQLMGLESAGMILVASTPEPVIVQPETKVVPGSRLS